MAIAVIGGGAATVQRWGFQLPVLERAKCIPAWNWRYLRTASPLSGRWSGSMTFLTRYIVLYA